MTQTQPPDERVILLEKIAQNTAEYFRRNSREIEKAGGPLRQLLLDLQYLDARRE